MSNSTFEETVGEARSNFLEAKKGLAHAMDCIPDDRVDWSPSSTARTPAQIVGHAAGAIKNIKEILSGNPFDVPTPADAEVLFRKEDEKFVGRQMVMGLLEESSAEYLAWLDTVTPEMLDVLVTMPFGLGQLPRRVALSFPYLHTRSHVPQLEYVQTIYGDRDWHLQGN